MALTLDHTTAASTPADVTRTTVGVGEQVFLTVAPPVSVNFTITGGGTLTQPSGDNTEYKAPKDAATSSIHIKNGSLLDDVEALSFTVLEPTGVTMHWDGVSKFTPSDPLIPGRAKAYMYTDTIKLSPTTVSFYNVEILEIPGPPTGMSGYFLTNTPPSHSPSTTWVGFGEDNIIPGGHDSVGFWNFPPPFSPGFFEWVIPWNYRIVGDSGNGKKFTDVHQTCTMVDGTGKMVVSKAGASVTDVP